jgi:hypothetical protein
MFREYLARLIFTRKHLLIAMICYCLWDVATCVAELILCKVEFIFLVISHSQYRILKKMLKKRCVNIVLPIFCADLLTGFFLSLSVENIICHLSLCYVLRNCSSCLSRINHLLCVDYILRFREMLSFFVIN